MSNTRHRDINRSAAASLSPSYISGPHNLGLDRLLHDLGATEKNLAATRLASDIYGGICALLVLQNNVARRHQAGAVAEAIIDHESIEDMDGITYIGFLLQIATAYDNYGFHPCIGNFSIIVHYYTFTEIHRAHPGLERH